MFKKRCFYLLETLNFLLIQIVTNILTVANPIKIYRFFVELFTQKYIYIYIIVIIIIIIIIIIIVIINNNNNIVHPEIISNRLISNVEYISCSCGKRCKGLRGLKAHQRSRRVIKSMSDNTVDE